MKLPFFIAFFLFCRFSVLAQEVHRNVILCVNGQIPFWTNVYEEKIVITYKNDSVDTIYCQYKIGELAFKQEDYEYIKTNENLIKNIAIRFKCLLFIKRHWLNCDFNQNISYYGLMRSPYLLVNIHITNFRKGLYIYQIDDGSGAITVSNMTATRRKYQIINNNGYYEFTKQRRLEMKCDRTDTKTWGKK
jgi:hypothetical protein